MKVNERQIKYLGEEKIYMKDVYYPSKYIEFHCYTNTLFARLMIIKMVLNFLRRMMLKVIATYLNFCW